MTQIATQIYNLITPFINKDLILPRSIEEINACLNEFVTIYKQNTLVACCGIKEYHNFNAIYCMAVSEKFHGFGYAKQLLQKALTQTTGDIIAMSKHQGEWFLKNGFIEIDKAQLPNDIPYNNQRKSRIFLYKR